MEFSYYSDSLHNYMVVPVMMPAQGAPMGYQYRMLAVNRMEGLLPAGLRTIDGALFLYYDITSRQSLADLCRDRMLPPELIRKLLYAVAAAGRTLSCYLLDDTRLLLGPEFIYYDFEREEFYFTYYPEPVPQMGYAELFQFLAEHVDPQEKRAAYVVYHLCELSGNQHFILKEDFLDREYGKDRRRRPVLTSESKTPVYEATEPRLREPNPGGQRPGGPEYEEPEPTMDEKEENPLVREESLPARPKNHLVRILIIAVLFLMAAIGLEVLQTYMHVTPREQILIRAGVIICLAGAILSALYGTFQGYRNSRRELQEEEERIAEEKRNEMTDTLEYDRNFVV